jgi:hypothetical protein
VVRIVIVARDAGILDRLKVLQARSGTASGDWEFRNASSIAEASTLARGQHSVAILVECMRAGAAESVRELRALRNNTPHAIVCALMPSATYPIRDAFPIGRAAHIVIDGEVLQDANQFHSALSAMTARMAGTKLLGMLGGAINSEGLDSVHFCLRNDRTGPGYFRKLRLLLGRADYGTPAERFDVAARLLLLVSLVQLTGRKATHLCEAAGLRSSDDGRKLLAALTGIRFSQLADEASAKKAQALLIEVLRNERRPTHDQQRPATSDQRPATSDQRPATSEQRTANSEQRTANSEQRMTRQAATPKRNSALKRLRERSLVADRRSLIPRARPARSGLRSAWRHHGRDRHLRPVRFLANVSAGLSRIHSPDRTPAASGQAEAGSASEFQRRSNFARAALCAQGLDSRDRKRVARPVGSRIKAHLGQAGRRATPKGEAAGG